MEEELQQTSRRRRKRRPRVGRILFVIFLFLAVGIGIYTFTQYSSGYKFADTEQKEPMEFNGDELKKGDRENILVLGVDSRGEDQARTDTMMIFSWDKENNDVKVISFMRDIYADIPEHESYKLNTAFYLGKVQLLKDTMQGMFDLPIHHYALIDFSSFESLVDIIAPDGVPVNVEKDMSEKIGVTLKKGQQNLNGKELLGYARFRSDAEGDFGRVGRQQLVMEILKDELLSIENVPNLPKFIGATEGYIQTDYSRSDKTKRILDAVVSGKLEMEKLTIPVEGTYSFKNYSHAGSVIVLDKEMNKTAITEFLEK
ncbi:transcriptional attenuator, LytR family [Psychrobacillus psychrotolerans]|uniref:Regulatory protein MsrR n=1 Tax=Psychrobacillus psychrotolerans TaxID=126156 RepID=A0A1I5VBR1_9BACI|nr:LCP family protein [Psychrobacillus psychrotolerans]SFQ04949.1 transcriptional attenuator, LytR family [Psychrobacillus psychrotolerans]